MAAIQPRPSGFHPQLSSNDRPGLLADVTRKLSESGLTITKAEVGRQGNHAVCTEYQPTLSFHLQAPVQSYGANGIIL
jgi:glycine cleavage system regulatory protein